MIHYKTDEEIAIMREGGTKLQQVFAKIEKELKPGLTTREVDELAEKTILSLGGTPSFKKVSNYKDSICISINDQVVHTPPSAQIIQVGDVVTVDIGMFYKGFNTDKAETYIIGTVEPEVETFLHVGKIALQKAIEQAIVGNYIGDISSTIQKIVEGGGYQIVRELTGHGVGRILHEQPAIPGFLKGKRKKTVPIKPGMTIAIEVIYAQSTGEIDYENGQEWSLVTRDGSLAACFEHTIAVLQRSTLILA